MLCVCIYIYIYIYIGADVLYAGIHNIVCSVVAMYHQVGWQHVLWHSYQQFCWHLRRRQQN